MRPQGLPAPHLRHASKASRRLAEAQAARTAWEAALDTLCCGVVLLDRMGRVAFANQQARRLDAARDGLVFCHGGISAPHAANAASEAIGMAIHGGGDVIRLGGHVAVPRRDAPCPLSVTVLPLARILPCRLSSMPVVLLLIVDPLR